MAAYLKVLFDLPGLGALTYENDPAAPAAPGTRVMAPLGRREVEGFVVEELDEPDIPPASLRRIVRVIDAEPLFGRDEVELARWLSGMYFCSQGEALAAMLPSGRRETDPETLEGRFGVAEADFEIGPEPLSLSGEQTSALERITRAKRGTWYLYGLTGTGKTEVFLQAAEAVLAEGRGVIYLVPEIGLTGQVVEAAVRRFGAGCAVLHSRLSPSRRLAEWRRLLRGEARVAIGARSAVFAPLSDLGLVVIDEEHEGSYKAGSAPRYHARQVAMKRCALSGARLVMGSATPSAEAWRLMEEGAMERLPLTRRLSGGAPPAVEVVDMGLEEGPISRRLGEALAETRTAGRQSILFLNRRGFSYFFRCRSCGHELRCRHCSVALTYHKEWNSLVCHYCGYRAAPPSSCPACGSLDVGYAGFGTERIEEEVLKLLPGASVRRLDADTTTRKGELEAAIRDFREGRTEVLLGTQMVAKGLNFPGVRTVGVVLADTTLNLPDFRAAERAFSLVVQVAGRAGRFLPDGKVIVQTYRPESHVIRLAAALDLPAFYRRELETRRELGFPPFARLVRVVFRSKVRDRAPAAAREFAHLLSQALPSGAEILGPAECPLGVVAGTARWQLIVRSPELGPMHRVLGGLLASWRPPPAVRVEPDVDPVSLM